MTDMAAPRRVDLTSAASVATPMIVLGAALLYFAGSTYQHYLLTFFGLPTGTIQKSLQQSMADGYAALLQFLIVPMTGALIYTALFPRGRGSVTSLVAKINVGSVRIRSIVLGIYVSYLLAFGWTCGAMAATLDYNRYLNKVSGKCDRCFYYVLAQGQLVGLPIIQDEKTTLILSRRGVVAVPTGSIRFVKRISSPNRLPKWLVLDALEL